MDTGSSISVISKAFFDKFKDKLSYKNLSTRPVTVTTINSEVKFHGCIDMSFKINKINFKHNFYISTLSKNSSFDALLGYEFITKHNVLIFPEMGFCKISNNFVYFNNHEGNKYNAQVSEIFQNNINAISKPAENRMNKNDLRNHVDARPFIPKSANPEIINIEDKPNDQTSIVKIAQYTSIPPNETYYVKAYTKINDKLFDTNLLLNPNNENSQLIINEAVYYFHPTTDSGELEAEENNSPTQNNRQQTLYLVMENKSSKSLHLTKDTNIGKLEIIEDIIDANKNIIEDNPHFINVITPSEDIIKLRWEEFSKTKINLNHLRHNEKNEILNVLKDNFQAFSSSLKSLGHSDIIKPVINFTTEYPVKALPFPVPQALQAEVKKQIEDMVAAGIIEKNIASWACPMILIKKKEVTKGKIEYRTTLDLRLLNAVIQHSSYPLPKIQQIIRNIANYKFFTKLDMPSAYHQIDLPEVYQDKICFTSSFGTYKFKRLPQGLKTSAGQFQAAADSIKEEVNLPGIETYLDDFIICANSFPEMKTKIEKILQAFKKHNLTLNLKKCSFHTKEVDYLGFKIANHKIFPITMNIKKIESFPQPKTKRQIKKFLGLCSFYRTLIPDYATIADPLIKLTSPKVSFKWSEEENLAFNKLQSIFFNSPFLIKPNYNDTFYVNTDASGVAISAVLMQKNNNNLLPVAYFSKTLKKSERNYPAAKLELMAIVKGIAAFRHMLYGREFIVLSDAKPLEYYKSRKITSPADIITRWLTQLEDYTFTFQYIPGKINILADYISRTPLDNNTTSLINNPDLINSDQILPVCDHEDVDNQKVVNNLNTGINELTIEEILEAQKKDKNVQEIIKERLYNTKSKFRRYIISPINNLLLFVPEKDEANLRIVIPNSLKDKCLRLAHFAHYGIQKTLKIIQEKYFWKGQYADVVNYVTSCTVCLTSKPQRVPSAPLQNTITPTRPGELLSIDFVGPFKNNFHILTVIDHFSKHLKLFPLRNITAIKAVNAIFEYITTFGRPEIILSDNGSQFKAHIFAEFNKILGINLNRTTVNHPEANAVSERINFSIKATIKALMKDGYDFWYAAKIHEMIYNNTFHNTIRMSPNKVHFGRSLSTFMDTFSPIDYSNRLDIHEDYYTMMQNLNKLYHEVHNNLVTYQEMQNKRQHTKAKTRNLKIDDIVYLDKSNRFKRSFDNRPYKVLEKCSPVLYKIQVLEDPSAPTQKIHINRLKLAPPRKNYLRNVNINNSNNDEVSPEQAPVASTSADDSNTPAATSSVINNDTTADDTHLVTPHTTSSGMQQQQTTSNNSNIALPVPKHRYHLRTSVRQQR